MSGKRDSQGSRPKKTSRESLKKSMERRTSSRLLKTDSKMRKRSSVPSMPSAPRTSRAISKIALPKRSSVGIGRHPVVELMLDSV